MLLARTPDVVSAKILYLCQAINSLAIPKYITITPEPGCEVNDCFECIRNKIGRERGRIQFGWSIWEWPRVYIEAEHHAVYEPLNGMPWLDITPASQPEIRRRLFLPDNNAIYSFENEGLRRDNKRMALNDDPLTRELFTAAEKRSELWNAVPGVNITIGDLSAENRRTIATAEKTVAEITQKLAMKYTFQNALCFCGSNRKFKDCHGQRRGASSK